MNNYLFLMENVPRRSRKKLINLLLEVTQHINFIFVLNCTYILQQKVALFKHFKNADVNNLLFRFIIFVIIDFYSQCHDIFAILLQRYKKMSCLKYQLPS